MRSTLVFLVFWVGVAHEMGLFVLLCGQETNGSLRRRAADVAECDRNIDHDEEMKRNIQELDENDRKYWLTLLSQEQSMPPILSPTESIPPTPFPTSPPQAPPSPRPLTRLPTASPTRLNTPSSTPEPTLVIERTPQPTQSPTLLTTIPTPTPTISPTPVSTLFLSSRPTPSDTEPPVAQPTTPFSPTSLPTPNPTVAPVDPTPSLSESPEALPTEIPPTRSRPTNSPPTVSDTPAPTPQSSAAPVFPPTPAPTSSPTLTPTRIPTIAPTPLPTISPSSMPSELPSALGQCSLSALSECVTLQDRLPCSSLTRVPEDELTCRSFPTELGWIYNSENCGVPDSARTGFTCRDSNGGPESSVVVNLSVRGTSTGQEYFSGRLFRMMGGLPTSTFVMSSGDPDVALDASVNVLITRANVNGELLQNMTIPTSCGSDVDSLTIGKKFGAADFVSYRTDETGLVQGSREVQWTYLTMNIGNVDAELKSVMTNTHGDIVDLMPENRVVLLPGEDFRVPVDKTISLVETGTYTGAVNFTASSTGGDCSASATSTFTIIQ